MSVSAMSVSAMSASTMTASAKHPASRDGIGMKSTPAFLHYRSSVQMDAQHLGANSEESVNRLLVDRRRHQQPAAGFLLY
jgi:hypothetical protein